MNSVHQIREYQSQFPEINSNSTIGRKYVHRQAVNEVFITSLHQLQDDHFMTTAVLPKSHMYSTFPRIATQKVKLTTGTIPAGSAIYADVILANRDPAIYAAPLQINPYREGNRHLQFGYGMHNCMGQELVRLEINTVVAILTQRFPKMRLCKDKLHHLHWYEGIVLRRPD